MAMTVNGVSTTKRGEEQFELFTFAGRKGKTAYQYDYRSSESGELFSIIRETLEECREKRDEWLATKGLKY